MRIYVLFLGFLCFIRSAHGQSFSDDFTRQTNPGPLAPWIVRSGSWTISNGVLAGGTNAVNSGFAFTYVTNSWANYSVQARIRFSTTSADGGGIGGRLNPNNGGHYAAWVSPENSPGGPLTLILVKFQDWAVYEYTNTIWQTLQTVTLPSVGTNWHSLRMDFQGNHISVYYDSNLVASATDQESNPYLSGSPLISMSTANTPYTMFADDFTVTPLPSTLAAANDLYVVTLGSSLTVAAPGVLSNDTAGANTNLSAVKLTNPAHGTATLNANGNLSYTPSNNFVGIDSFSYQVSDGITSSPPGTISIDVTPATNNFFENFSRTGNSNTFAPWITGLGDWSISGGVLLGAAAINDDYSDAYIPLRWGDYSIQTRFQLPASAWACGLSGRLDPHTGARYVVNVYPENSQLGPRKLRVIKFHDWENWSPTYTAMALVDLPAVGTSYHTLKVNFVGNTIDAFFDGVLAAHVVDNNYDGIPPYRSGLSGAHMYMYASYLATFDDLSITVLPGVNTAPVLPSQTNRIIAPLTTLIVTNTATDIDYPSNALSYALLALPPGASVDTNGIITWTPTTAQDLTTNVITTVVTDFYPGATNGDHLSATNTFTVVVNSRPAIAVDSTSLIQESCSPANQAVDAGETVTMLVTLRNFGPGTATNLIATLQSANGVSAISGPQALGTVAVGQTVSQAFSFAAVTNCGATITPVFSLSDGTNNLLPATVNLLLGQTSGVFTQAFDTVTVPGLPPGWTTTTTGVQPNWVTTNQSTSTAPNSAFSADAGDVGVNALVSPVIPLAFGPSQLVFANSWNLEVNTTTEGYDGGVLEIKIGAGPFVDILAAGGSFVANGYDHVLSTNYANPLGGRQAWSGNSGGFVQTIVNLPPSAAGNNIQLQWRCATDNGNGAPGWRIDSIGISSQVCCSNSSLTLGFQPDRTIPELSSLTVTNTATGVGAPFGYLLLAAPSGVSIDINGIISWTPSEAQGPGTNIITTVATNSGSPALSATNSFKVVVTEVNAAPVLPLQADQTIAELTPLVVTNNATDPDLPANVLTYFLLNPPAGAVIGTNTGVISWTPTEAQGPSTNFITTVVTDNGSPPLSATNTFKVTVTEVNSAPVLPVQADQIIAELTPLVVTNTATDSDLPANILTYLLLNPPTGAAIGTNTGVITWTPTEAQGPSTNFITTVVTDNGSPPLRATNTFKVIVTEVNSAPVLLVRADQTIAELTPLVITNTATDSDLPANVLTYLLVNPPGGAVINTNTGVINWTPTEAQGPSTNFITTVVTDNGTPPLSATNTFKVTVTEVNSAPVLPAQADQTIAELTPLVVTNAATDSDLPANVLTYLLLNPPTGAVVDTNTGVINWTPSEAQGPSTNFITTVVTDNGTPPLSATNTFKVTVAEVNSAPVLPVQADQTIAELAPLVVTNAATDFDLPANVLTYLLLNPPTGVAIGTNTGVITWTPTEAQGPSTNFITTIVTDNGTPPLSATNTFKVTVTEVNSAPVLPVQPDQTIAELTPLVVTNTATDSDLPANVLTYFLLNPPAGVVIDTNTGVITWTPTEAQGPSTNVITTVATDNGVPPLSATNSFTVIVNELNQPPVLPVQTNITIIGFTTLVVTNAATDADIPLNPITYALINSPSNATVNSVGVINWTPALADIPSTNIFTCVATDFNSSAINSAHMSATNQFYVFVQVPNAPAPFIESITYSNDNATLIWSAVAGRKYRVEYSEAIDGTNWNAIPPDTAATTSACTLSTPTGSVAQRFYRVVLLP